MDLLAPAMRTGVCECPPGFSGTYILSNENDCYISDRYKRVLNLVTFSSATFTVLVAVVALSKVTIEVHRIYRPNIFPETLKLSNRRASGSIASRGNLNERVLKRKLLMIQSMCFFMLYALCEVYRTAILVNDANALATEFDASVVVAYDIGLCATTLGIFTFLYIYTTSLPKGGQLAAVLGITYDARRYNRCK